MERNSLRQHKKGVSEMMGYVLLVVIAVTLSILVFAYLKLYIPKDKPECPDGVSLIVKSITCAKAAKTITVTFSNKGKFTIDGAYLRVAPSGTRVKTWFNKDTASSSSPTAFYFNPTLDPGKDTNSKEYSFVSAISPPQDKIDLEIQPVINENGKTAACTNAIITQTVSCN